MNGLEELLKEQVNINKVISILSDKVRECECELQKARCEHDTRKMETAQAKVDVCNQIFNKVNALQYKENS